MNCRYYQYIKMLSTVAALISYVIITVAPIVVVWLIYTILPLLHKYDIYWLSCRTCGHGPHHAASPLDHLFRCVDEINGESIICAYNRVPSEGRCWRCKHNHRDHIGETDADGRILTCDCGGAVSNYENDMLGYGRKVIDPAKFKTDTKGIIDVYGRPLYVHDSYKTIYVDEPVIKGYNDEQYTDTLYVPMGRKQKRTVKKTRKVNKEVPVIKTRMEEKVITPGGNRAVTTTSTKYSFGIVEHSRLETYPVSVQTSKWTGSGYVTGWHTEYKSRTIPARYGNIPYTSTDTTYKYEPPVTEKVPVEYTVMEWRDVDEEYETDIEEDVLEPKYVTKTRKVPITETEKVPKQQIEYSYTCACKSCGCPRCIYKKCNCATCVCLRCRVYRVAVYGSVILPVITTSVFIGVIPIVLGVESVRLEWASLIDSNNINYGIMFIILGISEIVAMIITVLWYISEHDNVVTRIRAAIIAVIMWIVITIQLTSLCIFAAVPVIVWRQELSINVLPCYIIGGAMIIVYSAFWILVQWRRIRTRIYGFDNTYIDILSGDLVPNYGSVRIL